jgi:Cu/Ag efflux pump CusA
MMRWIVASSLRFRFLVIAGASAFVFFGIMRLREMPVDVFPEFAPPRVEVQTEGQGMSSAEVEDLITNPMELVLMGTPELDVMRSRSPTSSPRSAAASWPRLRPFTITTRLRFLAVLNAS